ncbi:double-strand break repair helicase AddA [Prosthecomicrobium pneumaticum]|uniref:DNA 3'-5' helicase n=1 Tax=Prosthecomicrobium pneumaticum TaxID=81895 RepID=A0A7W9FNL2_9HYPH|nr:ATP-dependent helicase/nuclease subunit A [Prosthecomicrobium pneumaticum]
MSGRAVDPATRALQARATAPSASAWVSANAGSGKTFVLARRVVRLLLDGADPSAILCLTFTKAAAAEMSSRVFAILSAWTRLDDAALDTEIAALEGAPPAAARRDRARRLFARALETPGGLKIQTIHAFCERVLHQFPFEANVAGRFEVLDERGAAMLAEETRRAVIARAAADPGPLGNAFATVLDAASDQGIETALEAIVAKRDALGALVRAHGTLDTAIAALGRALGLAPGETAATLWPLMLDAAEGGREALARIVAAAAASDKPTDRKCAEKLEALLAMEEPVAAGEAYLDFYRTAAGDWRKPDKILTRAVRDRLPDVADLFAREIDRVAALADRIAAAESHAATAALLRLGEAAIDGYEAAKRIRGVLDFQDLVSRTADLLARSDAAAWVHYKLDRGVSHILVDEAQDTSPRQWQVVERLASEFFAGEGAVERTRTLFAVGDEKQSIYSFQGAVPAWFGRQRTRFRGRAGQSGAPFEDVALHLSFRSTPAVLAAVDAVFAQPEAHQGLAQEDAPTVHAAHRRGEPGRVTLWPPIAAEKRAEPEDWHSPLDHLDEKAPEITLAERIAATIKSWIDGREPIEATGRPIRAGNILILTRKRGAQTDAINRALKAAKVPVAGADRLALAGHIAVMDLAALGDVVLRPEDDLALAALLKSPLIGLSEEALFDLAHGRKGSLYEALRASDDLFARAAFERLAAWRARAGFEPPFGFYARILGAEGGRRRFLERLGPEADEVLDEFLAQALAQEEIEPPSLERFLAHLRGAATEIRRDPDLRRDEVRVMTVHGAKGLEAEIVFLVDGGSAAVHPSHDPAILALSDDADAEDAPLVWLAPRARRPKTVETAVAAVRRKALHEYRRLLYVGLTRARDRLIVCGTQKERKGADPLWIEMVGAALGTIGTPVEAKAGDETFEAIEFRLYEAVAAAGGPAGAGPKPEVELALAGPDPLAMPLPPAPPALRRLVPSGGAEEAPPLFPAARALEEGPDGGMALERGRIVHRLLQALPDRPAASRAAIGRSYLDAVAPLWPEAERAATLARLLALIEAPEHAALFEPGTRAEVAIAGMVDTAGGPASVSGRIDRLCVTPERVTILDYKTNRDVPGSLAAVPEAHITQLALYRAVLSPLYPGRIIDGALLYTETPRLIAVDAATLAASLATLTGP